MQMEFDVNSPVLFLLAGIVIAAVLAQSVFFLVKAWRRGLELGMEREKLKKIASTAAVFTIAPAAAIVISVMTLSKDLGLPLPWLRLSVVGSMSYETIAASNAERAMGLTFGQVAGDDRPHPGGDLAGAGGVQTAAQRHDLHGGPGQKMERDLL